MAYPGALQASPMVGANPVGYPFPSPHMQMPAGAPPSMQQLMEAAKLAGLANVVSPPQQPLQQQVQQQLLQGSGLLNAQPAPLGAWGPDLLAQQQLAQQLVQSACRSAEECGSAGFAGSSPLWKPPANPYAGKLVDDCCCVCIFFIMKLK